MMIIVSIITDSIEVSAVWVEATVLNLYWAGCLDSMERGTVEWNSGTVE